MGVVLDLQIVEELRLVPGLCDLPRELLNEVAASATQRRVAAGAVIHEQGAVGPTLDIVIRGAAKVVRTTTHAAGETTVVLDVLRAPSVLDDPSLFDGLPASASVIALRASHVVSIDRRLVLRLATQHASFSRVLFSILARASRRHVHRIDQVTSGPVDERIRQLLDSLSTDHGTPFGQGRFIAIPLRRRDLACMVNATTETVSRLLARFEREGQARSTRDGIWWRASAPVAPAALAPHTSHPASGIQPIARRLGVQESVPLAAMDAKGG